MRADEQRAGAHHARLEGDDERAVVEPPRAPRPGGVLQGQDLGVGGRVLAGLALVVALGDDHALVQHDGAHRHVAVHEGGLGLHQGDLHRRHVVDRRSSGLHGGGSGIRTHGELPHTRSPGVPIRPLSHPSGHCRRGDAEVAVAARRG